MVKTLKIPKDVNAPKRPQSAYILWMASPMGRQKVLADNPDLIGKHPSQVVKLAAARWNQITDEEKTPFVNQAEKHKAEYKLKLEAYKKTENYRKYKLLVSSCKEQQTAANEGEKPVRKRKLKKDPNAPKRPMSAYFLFSTKFYQENKVSGSKMTEISKAGAKRWREMTAEQKAPYILEAADNKGKYEQLLSAYRQTENYQIYEQRKIEFKLDEKRRKNKLDEKRQENKLNLLLTNGESVYNSRHYIF